MTEPIAIDRELARGLLASEATRDCEGRSDFATPSVPGVAEELANGERVLQRMQEHLMRWFGPDGVDALLMRSLERTRPFYPALAGVTRHAKGTLRLGGIADSVNANTQPDTQLTGADVREGIVALIATILALIGRLVGDDMVRHLLRQAWPDLPGNDSLSSEGSNNERSGK